MKKERIFNAKPAVFPANNTEEQNSVIKLLDILDKSRIKPEATFMDKYPNTDGYITITDDKQYPIGKCEIQIKTLPDINLVKPKYQCTLPFLSHCELSLLPVILIAVNANSEVAYWMHFFRTDLLKISDKIKGKSIVVPFPKTNLISRTNRNYIDEWTSILNTYIQKKFEYEKLSEHQKEIEKITSAVSNFPKPLHSISKEDLKSVSIFIDTINNALDNEFQSIKEILYHDYWKMSIIYSQFREKSVSYALVPIKYGDNDLIIREIESMSLLYKTKVPKLISSHHTSNPISNIPFEQAYSIIKNDTLDVIKNKYIRLVNIPLSQEYIIDFIDRLNEIFTMLDFKEYDLKHIKELIQNYFPLLVEEYIKLNGIEIESNITAFNISDLIWHTFADEVKEISGQAINRYNLKDFSLLKIEYISTTLDVNLVMEYLDFLLNQGIQQFTRQYPAKDYSKPSQFVWSWYTKEMAFEKISFLYKELAVTYNQFIEAFFPKLYDALHYNSNFDLQIIDLHYVSKFDDYTDSPGVTLYNLKLIDTNVVPQMKFYLNSKDCPLQPENFYKDYKDGVIIEGINYKVISSSTGGIDSFFEDYTLKNNLYKLLEDRFKEYFKSIAAI